MGGGLLNLVAYGNLNVILHGNPSKTFFKTSYAKHTNFGLQKFRLDYKGLKTLRIAETSVFTFKVERYADLLLDTYLVVNLPYIWSPIVTHLVTGQGDQQSVHDASYICYTGQCNAGMPGHATINTVPAQYPGFSYNFQNIHGCPVVDFSYNVGWYSHCKKHFSNQYYLPYEFKWIKNIGSQMIKKVKYIMGGQIIQEFTGQYLYNMVQRDFPEVKKKLFDEMTGNLPELNDPANYQNRNGFYPNAFHYEGGGGNGNSEPSIRARTLYIPLNVWSTLSSKMAIPLTSLQYTDFTIEIELRPINELYIVRNINDLTSLDYTLYRGGSDNIDPSFGGLGAEYKPDYISPSTNTGIILNTTHTGNNKDLRNSNSFDFNLFRFTHPPPKVELTGDSDDVGGDGYDSSEKIWDADIHLIATYAFLSDEERYVFAAKPQKYLIKEIHEYDFNTVTGNRRSNLGTMGLVSSWLWYYQRTDVKERNEWSNYTNWPYDYLPINLTDTLNKDLRNQLYPKMWPQTYNPYYTKNVKITGNYHVENEKYIMNNWGLLLDGKERESQFPSGVYNLLEKYVRTAGNSEKGLYSYNFSLTTDPFNLQPSGALNLSKFTKVEFEYSTIEPPMNDESRGSVICNAGNVIGITKSNVDLYKYNYNLHVMEERYNVFSIESGIGGLMFAR